MNSKNGYFVCVCFLTILYMNMYIKFMSFNTFIANKGLRDIQIYHSFYWMAINMPGPVRTNVAYICGVDTIIKYGGKVHTHTRTHSYNMYMLGTVC